MDQGGKTPSHNDAHYMQHALQLAREAALEGEVPIGALVVMGGKVIGCGANRTRRDKTVAGHAEIVAISEAERRLGDFRLDNAVVYVTVEPCLMCLGAIYQARIARVVYGAPEPKFGALGSRFNIKGHPALDGLEVVGGVLVEESARLLGDFFSGLRDKNSEK